jgi:hypothetical protein
MHPARQAYVEEDDDEVGIFIRSISPSVASRAPEFELELNPTQLSGTAADKQIWGQNEAMEGIDLANIREYLLLCCLICKNAHYLCSARP